MKAIRVMQPGDVRLVEMERPQVTPTSAVIRVKACGICGSDIHIKHGRNPYATYPRVLGHEVAGVVEEVGASVTRFKRGDRVVVEPICSCGECYPCRIGRRNVCEHLMVYGCHADGGFAEYMNVEERALHRLPDDISFEQGALVEPYTICENAVRRAEVMAGDICLVQGGGPMGLITADLCKSRGAVVLVSEPSAPRRELARAFGADVVIDPGTEDLKERVLSLTDGFGANVVFDAVSTVPIVESSIALLSAAGRFLEYGYGFGSAAIDFNLMNKKELTVLGTRHQRECFEPVLADFKNHLRQVDLLRTHVMRLDDFEKAFALFEDKASGACKVVLTI